MVCDVLAGIELNKSDPLIFSLAIYGVLDKSEMYTHQRIIIRTDESVAILERDLLYILGDAALLILATGKDDIIADHAVHINVMWSAVLAGANLKIKGTEIITALRLLLTIETVTLHAGNNAAHLESAALLGKVKNLISHYKLLL